MNWETDLHRLESCKGSAHPARAGSKQPEWLQDTPQIDDTATFDVILGSDVLYEVCFLPFPGSDWHIDVRLLTPKPRSMHSLSSGPCLTLSVEAGCARHG